MTPSTGMMSISAKWKTTSEHHVPQALASGPARTDSDLELVQQFPDFDRQKLEQLDSQEPRGFDHDQKRLPSAAMVTPWPCSLPHLRIVASTS